MRRVGVLIAVVAATAIVATAVGASGSGPSTEVLHVRIHTTDGFFVDNNAPDVSGGDIFGGSGRVTRDGKQIGTESSGCIAAPPVGGQCNATLILNNRGRIQLSGNVRIQAPHSQLAIVGGTWQFRKAHGTARLTSLSDDGSQQAVELRIIK